MKEYHLALKIAIISLEKCDLYIDFFYSHFIVNFCKIKQYKIFSLI